jgi:CheY-like chemotaxis protein
MDEINHFELDEAPNNVLLVEDNPIDRLEVRLHLEVMGFVVYDTASATEA